MIMQRAQFEQWAQRNGYLIEKLQDNHATYEFSSTLNAYHGWQAATEQSQKEIAELKARDKVLVEALEACKYDCNTGEIIGIARDALANVRGEVK